jgi:hypothetical protein
MGCKGHCGSGHHFYLMFHSSSDASFNANDTTVLVGVTEWICFPPSFLFFIRFQSPITPIGINVNEIMYIFDCFRMYNFALIINQNSIPADGHGQGALHPYIDGILIIFP